MAKHSVPLRRALAEAEQLVEREKDWIKNKFEGKLKELEKKRETMVRDAEELLGRRVGEFQSPASEADRRGRPDFTRPSSSKSAYAATRGSRRPRNIIRPASLHSRKNTRKIVASSTSRTGRRKRRPSSHYDQAWSNLIKNWTEGMARIDQTVSEVRDECAPPIPGMEQARARRLEAADRGPTRHAIRRLRRRSQPVSQRRTR